MPIAVVYEHGVSLMNRMSGTFSCYFGQNHYAAEEYNVGFE